MIDHYGKVRRDGLRIYTAAIQANTDPYLPVLEKKVPNLSQLSRQPLGVITVPLDRVVGSVSQGRSYAFTENFLPILDSGSEFASKWDLLYESVEASGVSQPARPAKAAACEGNRRSAGVSAITVPRLRS